MDAFDYLYLEPLIIERVRESVPGLADVAGIPDLASVDEARQVTPAVYVVYLGDDVGGGAQHQGSRGAIQTVTQNWAVVLSVHYADATGSGEGARKEAGPLLGALLQALSGWLPDGATAPMKRAPQQAPVAYANGYFYYPLVFQASFVYPRNKTWQK